MKSRCVAVFVCLFLTFNLLSFFSFLSCYPSAVHSPESIWEDDAKVTAYLNALPIHLPDTCVLHIRQEIPEKLHDLFCQRLYYRLPYELPVHLKVAHLEAYKKYLPPTPSQHRFIQGALESPEFEWIQQETRLAEAEKQRKSAQLEALLAILLLLLALVVVFWGFVLQTLRHRLLLQTSTPLKQEKELAEAFKSQAPERSQADLQMSQVQLEPSNQRLLPKSRLIGELQMRLSEHDDAPSAAPYAPRMTQMKILTDTDWRKFREHFEEIFPNYIRQLQVNFPALTGAEIRLFLLIKLGFGNNEIAGTLGISQESVYKSRFRLRKKLGYSIDIGLDDFIQAYSAASKPDVES